MTIEQEIHTALKAAIAEALESVTLTDADGNTVTVKLHAVKLDNRDEPETDDFDEELFPAIVIDTSTPVPEGHKSALADAPAFITVQTYMPNDPGRAHFAELTEVVFRTIHGTTDWEDYQTDAPRGVDINAILIASSEEPTMAGWVMEQRTECRVSLCIKDAV